MIQTYTNLRTENFSNKNPLYTINSMQFQGIYVRFSYLLEITIFSPRFSVFINVNKVHEQSKVGHTYYILGSTCARIFWNFGYFFEVNHFVRKSFHSKRHRLFQQNSGHKNIRQKIPSQITDCHSQIIMSEITCLCTIYEYLNIKLMCLAMLAK